VDEDIEMYGRMKVAVDGIESCGPFASLVPEVRTNFVYARAGARDRNDVLAVEGRITVVGGRPRAAGPIRFGASSHMARFMVHVHRAFPSVRAGINFSNDPSLVRFLEGYCAKKGWSLIAVDRSHEPDEIKEQEEASMPWKAGEVLRLAGSRAPKVIYENGAVGKEPVTAILGTDPIEVAEEMCELAQAYQAFRSPPPVVGKVHTKTLEAMLKDRLGAPTDKLLVPPRSGVDSGVVDIGGGKVLVVAEDPIFIMPGMPLDFFGWVTVHIGASDVAVMGVRPQFMTYSLLLPPGTPDRDLEVIVDSVHRAARDLGITIVGGHTGYYPGFTSPTIGGITVFSVVDKEAYITPQGARPGDDVLITKGPAIEASGALGVLGRDELAARYGEDIAARAAALTSKVTVVKDALAAREAGGVTAMHDATEGGVAGGLYEVAAASGVGMEVDERKMPFPQEVKAVCEMYGMDPLKAISEGTLILTCDPSSSRRVMEALRREGIESAVIGKATADPGTRRMTRRDGTVEELEMPGQDPFWPIFFKVLGA